MNLATWPLRAMALVVLYAVAFVACATVVPALWAWGATGRAWKRWSNGSKEKKGTEP